MNYTVESIVDGIAKVVYEDGSYAHLVLSADMTEEQVDALANEFAPKSGDAPAFLAVGQSRTAQPVIVENVVSPSTDPEWYTNRLKAYGDLQSQVEFITENGLEAWQAEVASIKAMFPKV